MTLALNIIPLIFGIILKKIKNLRAKKLGNWLGEAPGFNYFEYD